jgi:antitoxin ParD1/3/4
MNVSLTPELERLVHEKLGTGMYQTSSEVIREGLRLLKERDDRLAALRREVRIGVADIEAGSFASYTPSTLKNLSNAVKSRGRKALEANSRKTRDR